jgi:Fe-S cluster assembly protein SufD
MNRVAIIGASITQFSQRDVWICELLAEASQAVIVEDYRGEGRYLTCPVTEIRLEQGAVLSHHKVQEEDPQAWHLGGLRMHQQQNSSIAAHFLSAGGLLARTDIFILLDGEGADCNLDGLTLAGEGQLGDYHIAMEHARPHSSSGQLFKGVLAGKARAVFDGLIHVRQNAQKTQAMQNNRNLLLSRRALANSNPRLEILADDVKCNHGSTIGYLDPDALFYLRSRGISHASPNFERCSSSTSATAASSTSSVAAYPPAWLASIFSVPIRSSLCMPRIPMPATPPVPMIPAR